MYKLRIKRRTAAALAVCVIAGSGALAVTPASASVSAVVASPVPAPQAPTSAAFPKGRVVSRLTLNIREEPTSNSRLLGGFRPGEIISLFCKVRGQDVDGNDLWYLLAGPRPGYVAARYVENLSYVPYCDR
ncbi:SH3 domain-containing protein [Streptomyces sp. NPDC051569]|uniref:SH3 domain-containing protein n=1 Tax=Streptomyces sp. NPDC051569 TaxID=3365661 RepID=UPI0037B28BEC